MTQTSVLFFATLTMISGCSSLGPSAESLNTSATCKVWKAGALGTTNVVEVMGEKAVWKHDCKITGCSEVSAYFKGGSDIYTANSGLIKAESSVAQFDGKVFTVKSSLVKVAPFEFNGGRADYALEGLGSKKAMTISYNLKCTPRQAALATAILLAK